MHVIQRQICFPFADRKAFFPSHRTLLRERDDEGKGIGGVDEDDEDDEDDNDAYDDADNDGDDNDDNVEINHNDNSYKG